MIDSGVFYRRELVRLMQETHMLREDESRPDYDENYLRARLMPKQSATYSFFLRDMWRMVAPSFHAVIQQELREARGKLDQLLDMAALVFGGNDAPLVTLHCNVAAIHFVLGDRDSARSHYEQAREIALSIKTNPEFRTHMLLEPEEGLAYCSANAVPAWLTATSAAA